ncbi:hypothetical protein MYAM1_001572 [Malassezia yamatoensis]|uniref:Conserved oligomeric Golgi complex subunit 5 helical domain-containing protein n=1 Tax=Malassezia yamatoensis TaxID=253288 RepID=A0AAJ5YR05_9BASI|nr:hypothetical protein MYAM1_001572 [Malassezia yamatoensis]
MAFSLVKQAKSQTNAAKNKETSFDWAPFLQEDFNAQEFASQFLAPSNAQEQSLDHAMAKLDTTDRVASVDSDMRVALSRLNMSITEVDQQIHQLVSECLIKITAHSEPFLNRVADTTPLYHTICHLHRELAKVEARANDTQGNLTSSLRRIEATQKQLESTQHVEEVATHAYSIIQLLVQLTAQMDAVLESTSNTPDSNSKDVQQHANRVLHATETLQKIEELISVTEQDTEGDHVLQSDCDRLWFLSPHLTQLQEAAHLLDEEIKKIFFAGLRRLSLSLLSLAIQAADHRNWLANLVVDFSSDLQEILLDHMRTTLDLNMFEKQLNKPIPRVNSSSLQQCFLYGSKDTSLSQESMELFNELISSIWTKIRSLLVNDMAPFFTKIYLLEHALTYKHSCRSTATLLELVEQVRLYFSPQKLYDSPSRFLWQSSMNSFCSIGENCVQDSDLWRFIFIACYPTLLRIFQEMRSRVALLTESFSVGPLKNHKTVAMQESLAKFESRYLKSVADCLEDVQNLILSMIDKKQSSTKIVTEVKSLLEVMSKELELCNFDQDLQGKLLEVCDEKIQHLLRRVGVVTKSNADADQLPTNHPIIVVLLTLKQTLEGLLSPDSSAANRAIVSWEKQVKELLQTHLHGSDK